MIQIPVFDASIQVKHAAVSGGTEVRYHSGHCGAVIGADGIDALGMIAEVVDADQRDRVQFRPFSRDASGVAEGDCSIKNFLVEVAELTGGNHFIEKILLVQFGGERAGQRSFIRTESRSEFVHDDGDIFAAAPEIAEFTGGGKDARPGFECNISRIGEGARDGAVGVPRLFRNLADRHFRSLFLHVEYTFVSFCLINRACNRRVFRI